jgi:hypothetical protein
LRPESDALDVFQLWFNLEDPDGNRVLVVQP